MHGFKEERAVFIVPTGSPNPTSVDLLKHRLELYQDVAKLAPDPAVLR